MSATAPTNSMPVSWCAARVAEARAWLAANSQHMPGWHHVNELLSQLDRPPAPAVPVGGGGPGLSVEQLTNFERLATMVGDRLATVENVPAVAGPVGYIGIAGLLAELPALTQAHRELLAALSAVSAERDALRELLEASEGLRHALLESEPPTDGWQTEQDNLREQLRLQTMSADMANAGCAELLAENAALTARATTAEAEARGLREQLPPEGDGGLWGLQRLADYFHENGNRAALAAIETAAHRVGFCLAGDCLTPSDWDACPTCEWSAKAGVPAPVGNDKWIEHLLTGTVPEEATPLATAPATGEADPVVSAPQAQDMDYRQHLAFAKQSGAAGFPTADAWDIMRDEDKQEWVNAIQAHATKAAPVPTPGAAPVGGEAGEAGKALPEPGQVWRLKKSPTDTVSIVGCDSFSVGFRRWPLPPASLKASQSAFYKYRAKKLHYFTYEYELAPEQPGGPLLGSRENGKGGQGRG